MSGPARTGSAAPRIYVVPEPLVDPTERAILAEVRRRWFDRRPGRTGVPDARRISERLGEMATADPRLADRELRERLARALAADLLGLGPLDPLLHDPEIEDIACDGVGIPIFVHHRRDGWVATDRSFASAEELDRFVRRLAQRSGRAISTREPLLEATLPGGARLHASLGPQVTTRGSTFTIRRFPERARTPLDLLAHGTWSAELASFLWLALEAGRSMFFVGGTASGKTTTLNALLSFLPPERKVVSIEDTRELHLAQENWIPLSTREEGGADPAASIDMFDLLSAALRQRPDFLVVGEVRGREAATVFQAIATGKACLSTFHADGVRSMVHRMESAPISLPRSLLAAVPLLIVQRQVWRDGGPARRIEAVVEVEGQDRDTGEIVTSPVFRWDPVRDACEFTGRSAILAAIARERHLPPAAVDREWERRSRWLARTAAAAGRGESVGEFARQLAAFRSEPLAVPPPAAERRATPAAP